jgi:hypothetical protein
MTPPSPATPPATPPAAPVPDSPPPGSPHPALARLVTAWVWIQRAQTRRRIFAPTTRVVLLSSVGAPVGDPSTNLLTATDGEPDHALRVDLAVAGLDRVLEQAPERVPDDDPEGDRAPVPVANPHRRAALVTVRPGPLESLDADHAWSRAWLVACEVVGARPDPVYVANRLGWFNLTAPSAPVVVPRLRGAQVREFGCAPR